MALRYQQCGNKTASHDYKRHWVASSARLLSLHAGVLRSCSGLRFECSLLRFVRCCCVSTVERCPGRGQTPSRPRVKYCEICHYCSEFQRHDSHLCDFARDFSNTSPPARVPLPADSCLCIPPYWYTSPYGSVCCKSCEDFVSHVYLLPFLLLPFAGASSAAVDHLSTDRYILESVMGLSQRLCQKFIFQKQQNALPSTNVQHFDVDTVPSGFNGLGCHSNRSLSFVMLDAENHWMFAESLGLNASLAYTSPIVMVYDSQVRSMFCTCGWLVVRLVIAVERFWLSPCCFLCVMNVVLFNTSLNHVPNIGMVVSGRLI